MVDRGFMYPNEEGEGFLASGLIVSIFQIVRCVVKHLNGQTAQCRSDLAGRYSNMRRDIAELLLTCCVNEVGCWLGNQRRFGKSTCLFGKGPFASALPLLFFRHGLRSGI